MKSILEKYAALFSQKRMWLVAVPLLFYLFFAINHLTHFETADEHFWFGQNGSQRIRDYWEALRDRNWLATRINDKPGVSLALVSGVGIPLEDYVLKQDLTQIQKNIRVNFAFRFPLVLFTALAGLAFFWMIKRLFDNFWLALFFLSLLFLFPVIIGISQIVNPDTLLWIFNFATMLSAFLFSKIGKKSYAVFGAVMFGFALLSKYAALALVPYLFLVLLWKLASDASKKSQADFALEMKRHIWGYSTIVLGGLLVFSFMMPAVLADWQLAYKTTIGFKGMQYIFWPIMALCALLIAENAIWKNAFSYFAATKIPKYFYEWIPKIVYALLLAMVVLVVVNWTVTKNIFAVDSISIDTGKGSAYLKLPIFDKIMLQFKPLVYSLTPMMLLVLAGLWAKGIFRTLKSQTMVFSLSLFVLVFYAAVMKQGLLITIRYGIVLYPVVILLGALAVREFFFEPLAAFKKRIALWLLFVALGVVSVLFIRPFYFNYANALLPKNDIIASAWGYGGYEAAQYLNSLPNAQTMTIWSDYYGVCHFFVGKCIHSAALGPNMKKGLTLKDIAYVVKTRRGSIQNKNQWHIFDEYKKESVWKLEIDGRSRNYVQVYKLRTE